MIIKTLQIWQIGLTSKELKARQEYLLFYRRMTMHKTASLVKNENAWNYWKCIELQFPHRSHKRNVCYGKCIQNIWKVRARVLQFWKLVLRWIRNVVSFCNFNESTCFNICAYRKCKARNSIPLVSCPTLNSRA